VPADGFKSIEEGEAWLRANLPAMYQDGEAAPSGRKVGELQQAMDAITAGWARRVPVTVVSSINSPSVKPAIKAEAAERMRRGGGAPSGTLFEGVVYLFADRLNEAKATTVLYHEVLGHYGMRGNFGRDFDKHLETVAMLRREDVRAMIERTGMDPRDPQTRTRAAEEVLAYMAQTKPELTLVQRALALIRTFLRKLPGMSNLQMSDAELIRDYILPARRFVEGGGPGPKGGLDFAADFAQAIDPDIKEEALRRYGAGETADAVSAALGIGPTTMLRWAKQAGIIRSSAETKGVTDEKRLQAISLYEKGQSVAEVANATGL